MVAPKGTLRQYELNVTNMTLAPDGFKNTQSKVFNSSYPGPWIQACWGDDIEIKVTDYLENNGTTIHWHRIRQNGTLDMDGVNGVTQCPIATNDSFTYEFKATQGGKWQLYNNPPKYNTTFEEGKKYLLRIIITSVDSTWIFSIDNHLLQIVGSDFVPIHPYKKNHLLVGIGQRYHVIVEATRPLTVDNYWIRMRIANGCSGFALNVIPKEEMGILRYNDTNQEDPSTKAHEYGKECADEPYENLKPILPWRIGKPSNEQQPSTFQMVKDPLWLNFSDPTIINLHKDLTNAEWDSKPDLAVVSEFSANTAESWIYLLITVTFIPFSDGKRIKQFVPAAHPIHLHGHDFAILKQSKTPYWTGVLADMNFDNPPRRDVALLPAGGYLIIAFKAENPGSWLLHCHIAWHASSGLALQIMEREADIGGTITPQRMAETKRVCGKWNEWFADPEHRFEQDDSGI
ncbi:hypothetical protein JMJ35_008868 [Cladonia borealis]|uniref:Laccase n=1 Tax=Cladonia borealis TaxID=184061 RepID=A0AA39QSV6_9LECA|nr:hypothetical protein JMJ35_008868 [Cladonia borealis]